MLAILNPDPITYLYSYNSMLILTQSLWKYWTLLIFKQIAYWHNMIPIIWAIHALKISSSLFKTVPENIGLSDVALWNVELCYSSDQCIRKTLSINKNGTFVTNSMHRVQSWLLREPFLVYDGVSIVQTIKWEKNFVWIYTSIMLLHDWLIGWADREEVFSPGN